MCTVLSPFTSRHKLSWEEWVAAPLYRVQISGEGRTSYNPDAHPNYRDVLVKADELAEDQTGDAVRRNGSRRRLRAMGKSLRRLEADVSLRVAVWRTCSRMGV